MERQTEEFDDDVCVRWWDVKSNIESVSKSGKIFRFLVQIIRLLVRMSLLFGGSIETWLCTSIELIMQAPCVAWKREVNFTIWRYCGIIISEYDKKARESWSYSESNTQLIVDGISLIAVKGRLASHCKVAFNLIAMDKQLNQNHGARAVSRIDCV